MTPLQKEQPHCGGFETTQTQRAGASHVMTSQAERSFAPVQ